MLPLLIIPCLNGVLEGKKPRHNEGKQYTSRCASRGQILTLLIEAHASYRNIQTCLRKLCGTNVSLGSIAGVVVLRADPQAGVLSRKPRQAEIETVLALLDEVQVQASPALQPHIALLNTQIRLALDHILLFARELAGVQQQAAQMLGSQAVQLLAWAWQRYEVLGPATTDLLQGVAPSWQVVAQKLLSAWDHAVRASSAVENWHSIVRPLLTVHRTLSAGILALLAV